MRVFEKMLPLVLLLAASCAKEAAPTPVTSSEVAAPLEPWEPIDPGFIGCEGG